MRKRSHKRLVVPIVLSLLLLAVVIAWVVQAMNTQSTKDDAPQATVVKSDIKAQQLDTSDALSRYVTGLTEGAIVQVQERDIYSVQKPNWNEERVVAIKFPLLSAKQITGANVEDIDGAQAYVVDILDASKCFPSTQDDTMRLVLLARPSQEQLLPVILRTHPNTNDAGCAE